MSRHNAKSQRFLGGELCVGNFLRFSLILGQCDTAVRFGNRKRVASRIRINFFFFAHANGRVAVRFRPLTIFPVSGI